MDLTLEDLAMQQLMLNFYNFKDSSQKLIYEQMFDYVPISSSTFHIEKIEDFLNEIIEFSTNECREECEIRLRYHFEENNNNTIIHKYISISTYGTEWYKIMFDKDSPNYYINDLNVNFDVDQDVIDTNLKKLFRLVVPNEIFNEFSNFSMENLENRTILKNLLNLLLKIENTVNNEYESKIFSKIVLDFSFFYHDTNIEILKEW